MSAANPLKRAPGDRRRFRAIESGGLRSDQEADARPSSTVGPRCSYRSPDADFYCWKYGVWYNLMDCCYRHARQTYAGCAGCGQGEGNLRQNRARYQSIRRFGDPPPSR
ncbi:MAG TPA: hypothetical protein VFT43_14280 [Candidatus Polarisedimenticolia bacterium]|nr:hypothetical protein [Candidatus Polarisedimenticolia bacterium]